MLWVLQRRLGQAKGGRRIVFGQRRLKHRIPGDGQGAPADRRPKKVQHAGGEEDKDPGVYDGVDGDEDEGDQIHFVRLVFSDGVEVHPDLRDG